MSITPIVDIKPQSPVARLDRTHFDQTGPFDPEVVAPLVGMSLTFIRKVVGHRGELTADDLLLLLDQDTFHETRVSRRSSRRALRLKTTKAAHPREGERLRVGSRCRLKAGSVVLVEDHEMHRGGVVHRGDPVGVESV